LPQTKIHHGDDSGGDNQMKHNPSGTQCESVHQQ